MDLASKLGLMGLSMKVNGLMDKQMAEANFGIQMETFMMAIGRMIKQVGMDNITIQTELNLKETGKTINKMDLVLRFKLMEVNMKVALKKE